MNILQKIEASSTNKVGQNTLCSKNQMRQMLGDRGNMNIVKV